MNESDEIGVDGRVKDLNAAYIFEGGNLYDLASPFLTMPAWWRRFMFAVLEPREFMIYAYIVSFMGKTPIAYPTYANMKADLNLRNHNRIKIALDTLEDRGFLLIKLRSSSRIGRHPRNMYQRPSAAYTLRVLLDKGYIDAELRPRHRNPATIVGDSTRRDSQCITTGLRSYLKAEAYRRYLNAAAADRKDVLVRELQSMIVADQLAWEANVAPQITDADKEAAEEAIFGLDDGHVDDRGMVYEELREKRVQESDAWLEDWVTQSLGPRVADSSAPPEPRIDGAAPATDDPFGEDL